MRQSEALRQLGLGVQLRSLREKAGMTTRSVASSLGISRSSISRTERGLRAPGREEVAACCALFGVIGDEKEALLDRVGDTSEASAWLALGAGMREQLASLLVLEREAAKITCLELSLVPGLAQIADYSRLLMSTIDRQPRDVERAVATRLGRQATLSRPEPPHVRFVIDESVLSRTLGDESMLRAQLDHLLVLSARENVEVRVLPLDAPAHMALNGGFTLFELADGTPYAFMESQGFAVCLVEPSDLQCVVKTCNALEKVALSAQSSIAMIEKAAGRLGHVRAELEKEH